VINVIVHEVTTEVSEVILLKILPPLHCKHTASLLQTSDPDFYYFYYTREILRNAKYTAYQDQMLTLLRKPTLFPVTKVKQSLYRPVQALRFTGV
jgi:hypothetical protein